MAEIYLAEDREEQRLVVVKKASREVFSDRGLRKMFWDEARIATAVAHPNIVRVLDTTSACDEGFYVMEFLMGVDIAALLHYECRRDSRIPREHALSIASFVARALDSAHDTRAADGSRLDVVHRDVTPSNVHLSLDGTVRLLDFGVARAALEDRSGTSVGQIKGKLAYMAPEQIQGYADRRSDVYGLGVILYEMITCRRLFKTRDRTFADILRQRFDIVPPSERISDCPPELEQLVMKALASDPEQRYSTAAAFADAIDSFIMRHQVPVSVAGLAAYANEASLSLGGGDVEKTTASVYADIYVECAEVDTISERLDHVDDEEGDSITLAEDNQPRIPPPILDEVEGTIDVDFAEETALFASRPEAENVRLDPGLSAFEVSIVAVVLAGAVSFGASLLTGGF